MSKTTKRTIEEMLDMYGIPKELYTMHRGVDTNEDLRYDITEIPAMFINEHFNKTKGHIHTTGHNELYTVIDGSAFFLLQKVNEKTGKIKDFYYVEVQKGQSVIIPGDYYHVTVNVGKKTLKLGNWVSEECVSDYSYIAQKKGMCYYLVKGLKHNWVKNPNYKGDIPQVRAEQPFNKIEEIHMYMLL